MKLENNITNDVWVKRIFRTLNNILPGPVAHAQMLPANFKPKNHISSNTRNSAVIILLQLKADKKWYLTMIKRASYEGHHSGQMAFPGGKKDINDIDLKATCIRETFEEIGIKYIEYQIIGNLSPVYVHVSDINIYPFLAVTDKILNYNINQEVEKVFEFNFNDFLEQKNKKETTIHIKESEVKVPCFEIENNIIWGASAQIISELIEITKDLNRE